MFDRRQLRDFDVSLLIAALAIFVIGLLAICSATQAKTLTFNEGYVFRQMVSMGIALAVFFIIVKFPYQKFLDAAYILYAVNIILLLLVLIAGHVRLGAQRWFSIAGFAFQPSEFIKVTLLLALAAYVGSKKGAMKDLSSLVVPCILVGVPFVLVLIQPDLGTALLLVPIFFSVLFIGGAKLRHLATMVAIGLAGLPFFWHFLRDYQKQRLVVFLNPNADPLGAGYTIIQSKIAVGSGGLIGKGWLSGTQNQLNFLPERHTDFIFSVIGEEWGFLGALVLILLYFFIVKRSLNMIDITSDMYGKLIAGGIASMVACQVVINISMTIGLMPVVGVPLPLVSYGGSSLIATMVAVGLVLNVGMRRSTF